MDEHVGVGTRELGHAMTHRQTELAGLLVLAHVEFVPFTYEVQPYTLHTLHYIAFRRHVDLDWTYAIINLSVSKCPYARNIWNQDTIFQLQRRALEAHM
jgi:hypothetical protein